MYNQNWHVVYGPAPTNADISPDTQLTDAVEVVFRMDKGNMGDPGAEIIVSVYGDLADPNGQHDDGSWPDIVVATQTAYKIRDVDGEVNDDYEYTQSSYSYPYDGTDTRNPAIFVAAQNEAAEIAAHGDARLDWNGKDPMNRSGGPV